MTERPTPDLPPLADPDRDALEATPPSEFMVARARLAADLKARGEKGLAKAVLAMRKPTVTDWALRQLVRRHVDGIDAMRAARAEAEHAQAGGDAALLRAAITKYRRVVDGLVAQIEAIARDAGQSRLGAEHLQAARERLEALSQEGSVEPRAAAPPPPSPPKPPAVAAAPSPVDLARQRLREESRRRVEEAKTALQRAESSEAVARDESQKAARALSAATSALEAARAELEAAIAEARSRSGGAG
jgi:hypothetical protein